MGLVHTVKAAIFDDISEDVRSIAKGLSALGRNAPVIGNAVEGAQLLAGSASKFFGGDRKTAGKDVVMGIASFTGVDAQMLAENVNQVRELLKAGSITLAVSAAVLGGVEVVAAAVGGSQFVGNVMREYVRNEMGFGSGDMVMESATMARTKQEFGQARQAISNIRTSRPGKGPSM